MKNILKLITLLTVTLFVAVSCDYDESNYDMLTKELDSSADYYVQFKNLTSSTKSTGVSLTGALVEAVIPIEVGLLGTPLTTPLDVNISIDPSTTLAANMYTLSATKITIPAGKTSGSITLTTKAALMPINQTLKFVVNLSQGAHNAPAGLKATYNVKRIEFCPLVNGAADLVGSYSVTTDVDGYENSFTTTLNGAKLNVSGFAVKFMEDFWAETVVSGGTFTMDITGNGFVDIPRQYIYTALYNGGLTEYEIKGSGTWAICGAKPVLVITYDIYYPGDTDGIAKTYKAYLPQPYLKGTFTMN